MPRKDTGTVDSPPKGCASRYGIERFQFDKPSTWPDWLEYFNRYLVSARLTMADDDSRINELILCMGPPSNAIFQRCTLTAEEKKTYEKVTKMFSDHFRGARNIVYELARLHRTVQREGEPVDSFINAVFAQAENCDLDNLKMSIKDLLTQSQLIAGMANRKLAAELQMDPSITLEQVVQRLRLDENIASQQAMIHEASHAADAGDKVDFVASEVDAVTLYRKRVGAPDRYRRQRPEAAAQCPNCGYDAHASVQLCPARRKACNLWKKVGHFAKVCKSKRTRAVESVALRRQPTRIVSATRTAKQTCFLDKVATEGRDTTEDGSSSQPWRAELLLSGAAARFKLDSGADVTCIPEGHPLVPAVLCSVTGLKLLGPSNRPLHVLGSFQATLKHKEHHVDEMCYVIRDLGEPLLSRQASVSLHLIQKVCFVTLPDVQRPAVIGSSEIDANSSIGTEAIECACRRDPEFAKVVKKYPTLFKGLGTLKGEYKIQLKPGAEPHAISAPRRVAIHYRGLLRRHLKQMVRDKVIRPVEEPTEWCSGIVVVPKADGKSVRICVGSDCAEEKRTQKLVHAPYRGRAACLVDGC
ncbi:hypothetical protein M513_10825 [Trichuris suis]|uniref:Peptidase A2 domain-containing protein n=1 Tax=Trichuris suis TaxID=68888 RepID=A0A085LTN7_9BILA|nr:hypothetical protein M513_10825 [Trichuris suis]